MPYYYTHEIIGIALLWMSCAACKNLRAKGTSIVIYLSGLGATSRRVFSVRIWVRTVLFSIVKLNTNNNKQLFEYSNLHWFVYTSSIWPALTPAGGVAINGFIMSTLSSNPNVSGATWISLPSSTPASSNVCMLFASIVLYSPPSSTNLICECKVLLWLLLNCFFFFFYRIAIWCGAIVNLKPKWAVRKRRIFSARLTVVVQVLLDCMPLRTNYRKKLRF